MLGHCQISSLFPHRIKVSEMCFFLFLQSMYIYSCSNSNSGFCSVFPFFLKMIHNMHVFSPKLSNPVNEYTHESFDGQNCTHTTITYIVGSKMWVEIISWHYEHVHFNTVNCIKCSLCSMVVTFQLKIKMFLFSFLLLKSSQHTI